MDMYLALKDKKTGDGMVKYIDTDVVDVKNFFEIYPIYLGCEIVGQFKDLKSAREYIFGNRKCPKTINELLIHVAEIKGD